jgi:nitrogen regulatory protein PII
MELKKIVAIVRTQVLGDVEAQLVDMRVKGIIVTNVMGYGECNAPASAIDLFFDFPKYVQVTF